MSTPNLDRVRFVTRHFNELQGLRYGLPLGLVTLSVGGTTYFANWPLALLRLWLFLGALFLVLRAGPYYRRTFGTVERQPVRPAAGLEALSIYSPAGPPQRLATFQLMNPVARRLSLGVGLAFVFLLILRGISPTILLSTDESLIQAPWLTLQSDVDVGLTEGPIPAEWSWVTLRVQMTYALFGALFLGVWLWRGRRRSQSHYLAFGALLLGLAGLGAAMGFPLRGSWDPRLDRIFETFFLPLVAHLWVALILCGGAAILTGLLDHWQLARVLGKSVMEEPS